VGRPGWDQGKMGWDCKGSNDRGDSTLDEGEILGADI
jgi:hypothetical protein